MKLIEKLKQFFLCFFLFFYNMLYKKETKRHNKIVHVQVHTASCKPSILNWNFTQ